MKVPSEKVIQYKGKNCVEAWPHNGYLIDREVITSTKYIFVYAMKHEMPFTPTCKCYLEVEHANEWREPHEDCIFLAIQWKLKMVDGKVVILSEEQEPTILHYKHKDNGKIVSVDKYHEFRFMAYAKEFEPVFEQEPSREIMKNVPEKIYLTDIADCRDFITARNINGISWNDERLTPFDIEYVRYQPSPERTKGAERCYSEKEVIDIMCSMTSGMTLNTPEKHKEFLRTYYRSLSPSNGTQQFENMQYYMEYCQANGYVTPQEWIEKHKHF